MADVWRRVPGASFLGSEVLSSVLSFYWHHLTINCGFISLDLRRRRELGVLAAKISPGFLTPRPGAANRSLPYVLGRIGGGDNGTGVVEAKAPLRCPPAVDFEFPWHFCCRAFVFLLCALLALCFRSCLLVLR